MVGRVCKGDMAVFKAALKPATGDDPGQPKLDCPREFYCDERSRKKAGGRMQKDETRAEREPNQLKSGVGTPGAEGTWEHWSRGEVTVV